MANGSSVPAWPVWTPPSERRTAATTSCEVSPAGLSISSTPSIGGGLARARRPLRRALVGRAAPEAARCSCAAIALAQERDQLLGLQRRWRSRPRARCPPPPWARAITDTSTSSSVARSETLCWPGALAAEDLAHEHRDLRALQRPQLVDDALGVALLGVRRRRSPRRSSVDQRELAVVEALDLRERDRRAARACRSACPRTGAGRRPGRRRPLRSARRPSGAPAGPVFSYMKRPVSVIRPM